MTGEMSKADVTREAYPIHFAIADALGGDVRPFDVYQGPYVYVPARGRMRARKFWLISEDGFDARIYDEISDRQSPRFFVFADSPADYVTELCASMRNWHKVKRAA